MNISNLVECKGNVEITVGRRNEVSSVSKGENFDVSFKAMATYLFFYSNSGLFCDLEFCVLL